METVSCNFCKSEEANLIGTFSDIEFNQPGEFSYVQCQNCGLIYLRNRPTSSEITQYYPPHYQPYRKAIQDERFQLMRWARTKNIQRYCSAVDRFFPQEKGKILDIGCSTGIFLDAMKQNGWDSLGVEISHDAVSYAQNRFDLKIIEGQLGDLQMPPKSFEAITMWNVFEHVYDPKATLETIFNLLKDGGILVMVYPSWESIDRKIFGDAWVGYDAPRHLYAYPKDVSLNMLRTTGFEIIDIRNGPNNYFAFTASLGRWAKIPGRTPTIIKNLILSIANFTGSRYLFQPIFTLLDFRELGGTLMITARKLPT